MQAILERLLGACNKHGLVMQVPAVAAQVMEWVSVGDPDAPTLMGQIKTIDVFKVYHAEARVQSTRATQLCQCHCISRSFVSVPMHLLFICVSAIAHSAQLCQCQCISRSFVSVPLHLPLICISASASPAHLYQCQCISC